MAIVEAYFDASGTHDGSPAVSVAGYLAFPEQWEAFAVPWKAALDEYGLSHFHMKKFANKIPPYDWKEPVRRQRITHLIGIINGHVLGSVGDVISLSSYSNIFPERAKHLVYGAVNLAAMECMERISGIVGRSSPENRVVFIFESGTDWGGRLVHIYNTSQKSGHLLNAVGISFRNKKLFMPCQAADILAYELFLHLPRQLGLDKHQTRTEILKLLSTPPFRWTYPNEDRLRMQAEDVMEAIKMRDSEEEGAD